LGLKGEQLKLLCYSRLLAKVS